MTRTIQTAINAFPSILSSIPSQTRVEIWPDLREAHDAVCNKGVSRADMAARFPQFDFTHCPDEWDYSPHTVEAATARAEAVRRRLKGLAKTYSNIAVITHRGFIAFLVQGDRFGVCETRSYRFSADDDDAQVKPLRMGVNIDTDTPQDFGPTVLIPCKVLEKPQTRDTMSTIEPRYTQA